MRRPIAPGILTATGAPMANVQLEKGYTRTANQLEEAIIWAPFSGTEYKIVGAIKRLTYGWRRRTVRVSQPALAEYCRVQMAGGFRRAFESLLREGVIIEVEGPSGRSPGAYALNKNFERWGRYSVPAGALEAVFKDRPNHADDSPRAAKRIAAATTDEFQRDLDLEASGNDQEPPEEAATGGQGALTSPDRSMTLQGQSSDDSEARSMTREGQSNSRSMTLQGGLTDPTGRLSRPYRDSHNEDNPASDNDLAPPKDIERHRKTAAVKKGEPGGGIGSTEYESRITNAALAGVTVRWPGARLSTRHASDVARALMDAGVDVELAVQTIRIALARKLGDAPGSIAWLKDRVLDAHRDAAHEALKQESDDRPRQTRKSSDATSIADLVDGNDDELRRDYDSARKAAGIAWAKDPANAAAYRSIVSDSNARFADMLSTSWGVTGRDRDVLDACIDRASFIPFDQWKRERKGAEHRAQPKSRP